MKAIGKYLLKPCLLFLPACFCTLYVSAQVKTIASVNKQIVAQNDLLTLSFSIENAEDVQQFIPPSFTGCKIVQGPTHVNSSSIINGVKSSAYSFVYVVQPVSPGKYCFSGASAKVNGKRLVFNTLNVDVRKVAGKSRYDFFEEGDDNARKELYSDYILRRGENLQDKIRKNLFIKVDVDKTSCYEGEAIVATYKLYTRLRSESKVTRRPSFNGFSVYDMVDPSVVPSTIEKLNGRDFNVYLIRKVQLFPLQSGRLELDAAEVDNAITFLKAEEAIKNGGEGLSALLHAFEIDDIKNSGVETQQVSIRSNPVAVTVKALPAGKPESFNGAVGSFSIQSAVNKKTVALNDAAVLKVIVKGEGNFGVMNTPEVHWPKNIEGYEPNTKEDFLKNVVPMRGYKAYEFTFTPKQKGDIILKPVEFSFFDPVAKQYKTISTDSIKISATEAIAQNNVPAIKPAANSMVNYAALPRPVVLLIGVILLAAFSFFLYRYIKLSGMESSVKSNAMIRTEQKGKFTKALPEDVPVIQSPLFNARLLLVQQDSRGFYSELKRSLKDYAARKYDCAACINIKEIEQQMRSKGLDSEVISQFSLVIKQCEIALYNPSLNEADMQSVYDLADDFVEQTNAGV
ncbi:MAG: BatD family protein [Agriterribacter sp.]